MTDLSRLIRLGRALLAADSDVERLRQSCVRNRMTDAVTVKLTTTRRGLLLGPLRAQLDGETLHMDDLAYLRALHEVAVAQNLDDVAARCDDVISAVDHALSPSDEAGRRAA